VSGLFLRALKGERVERFPVWMMRQAGRYLPGYAAIREKASFMDLCRSSELAAMVSREPVERFDVDAAIVFADILVSAGAMGIHVEIGDGGPRIVQPLRNPEDVARLREPAPGELRFVSDTIRMLRSSLPPEKAVIGFSAAPFTLVAYMIEGGTSRDFGTARAFAHEHPDAFRELLEKAAQALVPYLREQAEAGADALQLFDTWAGVVDPALYREAVVPAIQQVVEGLGTGRPPVILFAGLGSEARIEDALATGVEAISVDWRTDLGAAYKTVRGRARLQGNLDPAVLLASPDTIREETRKMLEQVPQGAPHLANLGHGILKETPPDHVAAFVEAVREFVPVGAAS
jgi:uroporphyrinogen decarboxylase